MSQAILVRIKSRKSRLNTPDTSKYRESNFWTDIRKVLNIQESRGSKDIKRRKNN